MAYSPEARALRQCHAISARTGQRCKSWACWGDSRQLCTSHGGVSQGKPVCHCPAFEWPHRPCSGGCRWPSLTPAYRCRTPAGTRKHGVQIRRDRRSGKMLRWLARVEPRQYGQYSQFAPAPDRAEFDVYAQAAELRRLGRRKDY